MFFFSVIFYKKEVLKKGFSQKVFIFEKMIIETHRVFWSVVGQKYVFFSKMFCATFCHKKGFFNQNKFSFFKSVSLNLFFQWGVSHKKKFFPHGFPGFLFFCVFFSNVFFVNFFFEEFCFRNVSSSCCLMEIFSTVCSPCFVFRFFFPEEFCFFSVFSQKVFFFYSVVFLSGLFLQKKVFFIKKEFFL